MATPWQGVISNFSLLASAIVSSCDTNIRSAAMNIVPLAPIQLLVREVTRDLHVVVAASELGYRETALEACLLAKEKLQAIREELLRPEPGIADPRYD